MGAMDAPAARTLTAAEWHAAFLQVGSEFRAMLSGRVMALGSTPLARVDPGSPTPQHVPLMSDPRPYSEAFTRTLATLSQHGVGPEHAGHALALWQLASAVHPAEPHIALSPEGAVEFPWNNDGAAMTLSAHPDGRFEWWGTFDRAADHAEGSGDDPIVDLPASCWAFLRRFVRP